MGTVSSTMPIGYGFGDGYGNGYSNGDGYGDGYGTVAKNTRRRRP